MNLNFIAIIIVAISVVGCSHSGYKRFYKPYVELKTLTDVEFLKPGENPQVFGTNNLDRDVKILFSKDYRAIGESSFNGGIEDTSYAAKQAKRIGATVVVTNSIFTNTQTSSSVLFVPQTQTTYYSGNNGFIGTSTTQSNIAIPQINQQNRYDQRAIYLVKNTQDVNKGKMGIQFLNLTPELRIQLERNTGLLVDYVLEDSPAFYANILSGDVVIAINGEPILNANHLRELLPSIEGNYILTIIRNGSERNITIKQ